MFSGQVSTKIPLARMDEKYSRVLQYCEKEVEHILRLFRRQKDDPPLPRNFPPIAGEHAVLITTALTTLIVLTRASPSR